MGLGIALNEDNSHFFASRSAEQMSLEGLYALVDQYALTQVSDLLLCPNCMCTSYASAVWDPIWHRVADPAGSNVPWIRNAWLLHQRGLDPYAVWIARAREKGLRPWLSMRMNDVHYTEDPAHWIHSRFWLEHPQYWRRPGSHRSYFDRALDYGHAEVREHHLKLVRELLERYDADGLELDWMRFGYHFRPGHERQGGAILTGFLREVRQLTRQWQEKRGHAIALGVRVPARPHDARGLGMDAVAWARLGLVDQVVATPFWTTADFDIPVEQWRELLDTADHPVTLAAGLELLLRAHPHDWKNHRVCDLAAARGFAAAMLQRGAERIYLFNYMDRDTTVEDPREYPRILREVGDLASAAAGRRRHVVTFPDTRPPGVATPQLLPAALGPGGVGQFRLDLGPKPTAGSAVALLGLAEQAGVREVAVQVHCNGAVCTALPDLPEPGKRLGGGSVRGLRFGVPLWALQDGYNVIELIYPPGKGPSQSIVWVEVEIDPADH